MKRILFALVCGIVFGMSGYYVYYIYNPIEPPVIIASNPTNNDIDYYLLLSGNQICVAEKNPVEGCTGLDSGNLISLPDSTKNQILPQYDKSFRYTLPPGIKGEYVVAVIACRWAEKKNYCSHPSDPLVIDLPLKSTKR
jgi:hypothetical protein